MAERWSRLREGTIRLSIESGAGWDVLKPPTPCVLIIHHYNIGSISHTGLHFVM